MANYAGGATAVCPFYQHESRYTVTCEGLYDDCVQQVKFNEAADKTASVSYTHLAWRLALSRQLLEKRLAGRQLWPAFHS